MDGCHQMRNFLHVNRLSQHLLMKCFVTILRWKSEEIISQKDMVQEERLSMTQILSLQFK